MKANASFDNLTRVMMNRAMQSHFPSLNIPKLDFSGPKLGFPAANVSFTNAIPKPISLGKDEGIL